MTPIEITNLIKAISTGNTTYGSVSYVTEYIRQHPEDTEAKQALTAAVLTIISGGTSQGDMYALSLLPLYK